MGGARGMLTAALSPLPEGKVMLQIITNGLMLGTSYALIALGLTLIFGIMNIVNFAHGQMYMIGSFVVYYLYGVYHWNFFLALLMCILVLAVIGAIFERFFFRRFQRLSTRGESSMLLALGTALLLQNIALVAFGEKNRGVPPLIDDIYNLGGLVFIPGNRVVVFVVSLVLMILLLLFIRYTKLGLAMQALAQDKDTTRLMGVNTERVSMLGFALGAALAGVAGGSLALIFPIFSGSGAVISIKSFIMIMIGGAGVVPGAIIGGFILGMLESVGYALIPGSGTYLIIFVAVILLLIFRPLGIMGKPGY
jgi:branched-chain amino acid transport system permease protein